MPMLYMLPGADVHPDHATPAPARPVVEPDAAQREALITSHLPLVKHVAGLMARHGSAAAVIDYDDLVGYGVEGLIEAVDSFDPSYQVKFSTWAVFHIRTTIQDALRMLDPLPRSLRGKSKQIERTTYELAHRAGCWPSTAEVAAELGVPTSTLRTTLQEAGRTVVSLDSVTASADDNGSPWQASLVDEDPAADPEGTLDSAVMHDLLKATVDTLPEREATVIRRYYQERQSMRTIAAAFGVSESRISQLHARALQLLRAAFAVTLDDAPRQVA
ncbi:MAG: sigma-70 family RNA polymerase sigma factor [Chloroflexi bacterium]|nr:sigma-70 family RNA polymerase sigma factor [Chloroflexota bacterium]